MHAILRDYLAYMMLEKTTVSLNPGSRVMKNTLLMMRPMGVIAEKSTRICLIRQTNYFTIRPNIANLAPLYIFTI